VSNAILKWFAAAEGVEGAPGLDLPALDTAAIATGYGVSSRRVDSADELSGRSPTRSPLSARI
jgi:benzoylformate decarboxylase